MVERVQRRRRARAAFGAAIAVAVFSPTSARTETPGASTRPACTPDPDPSADLERTFRESVRAYSPPDGGSGGAFPKDEMRFAAREAERVLLPHGDLLKQHVRRALGGLPREALPDMTSWVHLPVQLVGEKDLAEAGADVPLRGLKAAMFRDPTRVMDVVRSMSVHDPAAWKRLIRVRELEGLAPPRLVWANEDVEHPALAWVKRREIFEIDFAFDGASSSYFPRRIVWAKRPAPAPPAKPASDPGEAVMQAFTDAVESYDVDGAEDGPNQFIVKANAFAIERGRQLFAGKAEALHARARCELLKRARRAMPDTTSWRLVSHGDPPNTMPAASLAVLSPLKWEPARYFVAIRETTRRAVEGATVKSSAVMEGIAPPAVSRTNDDADNPTLAVIDHDEVFAVTFHYDPAAPGYLPTDIKWLRRGLR
jgi:hypothetical protein